MEAEKKFLCSKKKKEGKYLYVHHFASSLSYDIYQQMGNEKYTEHIKPLAWNLSRQNE